MRLDSNFFPPSKAPMGGFLNPPIRPYNIPAPFLLAWCLYKSLGGELWKPRLVPPYLKTSCGVGETKEVQ